MYQVRQRQQALANPGALLVISEQEPLLRVSVILEISRKVSKRFCLIALNSQVPSALNLIMNEGPISMRDSQKKSCLSQ
jgi:hypothetical protein